MRGGIARRGFLLALGGLIAVLGLGGFVKASGAPRQQPQGNGWGTLTGSRVQIQGRILTTLVTALMRISEHYAAGDRLGAMRSLPETFNDPANSVKPNWILADAWTARSIPGVRTTPTSKVYMVAPGWIVIEDTRDDTPVITVVDFESPESTIHPCAQVILTPNEDGPTEGMCQGLDWTTHTGVLMRIRLLKEREAIKKRVGPFSTIAAFFVPAVLADSGCGDTCGCCTYPSCSCWGKCRGTPCTGQCYSCYYGVCGNVDVCCCTNAEGCDTCISDLEAP